MRGVGSLAIVTNKGPMESVKVKFGKSWSWAERGCIVHDYKAGEEYEVPPACAENAKKAGVLEKSKKAKKSAPKNKAEGAAPLNKRL